LVLALPTLAFPIGWDQAVYGLAGREILRHGFAYRQFIFDTKAPPIHFLFAFVEAFFGNSVFALRGLDVLILAAGALCLDRFILRYSSPAVARLGAWLYVLLACYRDAFWSRLQPETVAEPLLFLALGFAARRGRGREGRALLAGLFLALCVALKITLLVMIAPIFYLLWQAPNSQRGRLAVLCAVGFIGSAFLILVTWLPGGLWKQVWLAHVDFTRLMYLDRPGWNLASLSPFVRWARRVGTVVVPLALVGLVRIRRSQLMRIVTVWCAAIAVSIVAQGHFHVYHFSPLIPPLSAAAAYVFWLGWRVGRAAKAGCGSPVRRAVAIASQYAVVTAIAAAVWLSSGRIIGAVRAVWSAERREAFGIDLWVNHTPLNLTGTGLDESYPAARWIRAHTASSEKVFADDAPLVLFFANREPTDPYVFNQYWIYRILDAKHEPAPFVEQMRDRVIEGFLRTRPRVAIFVDRSSFRYPAVRDVLIQEYRRLHGYVRLWVFVRRDAMPAAIMDHS
jgi:hypothetical protein